MENNLSEDSHDSVEPGPAGDESYAIASDFLYNLLPGGGSINSASRIRVDAENPRKTSDSGADSEVLRGAAGSMLYRMMPFISILPSVLEIALGSVGRSISFGSRLNFLMDRHQYKIYKLIKNLYQTCLGYISSVLFYIVARADQSFPRDRLPEIVKSCSKLRKLLAGYQNILGLQIFRPSPGKSNAAPNFENIQSKVSKFLQTGPTPRTEIQNDSFEELRGGSTVEAMDNSETQTAQLRGASIKAMDNSDSQPIGAEIFFSLQNGDLDCPHGSSDTDSIPDISCEEDGTEKRHIPTVYGCDYGEDPVPADTDADEGAKPKNNTFANFRPMEMKSLVKIKEGRMKKLNNGYINPANNPGKVSQDRSPSPDLDMMLYDNYKRDIKKEKKNARQIKKKKVIGRMHNLRSAYIDQYKIDNNDGKRVATSEIMKNRGLMPKRKREHRNPRIKKRMKYEKSLIKLRTIRPVARDSGSLEKYHGELTGIKSDISRSIRLS